MYLFTVGTRYGVPVEGVFLELLFVRRNTRIYRLPGVRTLYHDCSHGNVFRASDRYVFIIYSYYSRFGSKSKGVMK